jgi:NADH-quinone oxidoreductase subunit H
MSHLWSPMLAQEQLVELGGWGGPTFWRWLAWLLIGFFGVFPGIVAYMVWLER